jgi:hypothetical protein
MRARRFWLLAAVASTLLVAACSLNPQPLPPGNPDGSTVGLDAGKEGAPFFDDAGGSLDAEVDAQPPPTGDGGADADAGEASDASEDASLDASDAAADAADDAGDASND